MKHLIVIVAFATYVCGCAVVSSDAPMGMVARIDPAQWEGVWIRLDDPAPIRFHVVDADNGELSITDGEPTETDPHERRVFVRRYGDWTYLNTICGDCPPEDRTTRYLWCVAENSNGVLLLWEPDVAKFESLVAAGELPGDVVRADVQLHALEPHHYDLIQSEDRGTPVDWRHPIVLQRSAVEVPAP